MKYKRLGNTDMDLSVLTIGTWAMGGLGYGAVEEKECIEAIHAMIDQGVNHIDTAWIYGLGHSDEVVGKAIKGLRDKVYITTKAGFRNPADGQGPNFPDCSPAWLRECLDKSLVQMGVDYFDEFLVHFPDRGVAFAEIADCVNSFIKEGKVRYVGVSNFQITDMEEMSQYMSITANQVGYSMIGRGEEEGMRWAKEHGIGVMTHSSLGSGLLTGAIRTMPDLPDNDVRKMYSNNFTEPRFSQIMKLLETLDKVAESRSVPVAQVAINWNVRKDFVTTSLVGVRNVKEALENCKAVDWELTDDEMKLIDDAIVECLGE